MEVKIQCPCETHFAFDVEPVNGRMPVRVNCPGCGADQTELANEVIRQKLASAAPGGCSGRSRLRRPAHARGRTSTAGCRR